VAGDVRSMLKDPNVRAAVQIGLDPNPYSPEYATKSQAQRVIDNLYWLQQYGEVNRFYYCYKLDRIGVDIARVRNCIPTNEFTRLRNASNWWCSRTKRELKVLTDKIRFQKFASEHQIRTPQVFAFVENQRVQWIDDTRKSCSIDEFLDSEIEAFCKPVDGKEGKGAFRLQISGGQLKVNGNFTDRQGVKTALSGRYLLQEVVVQHAALSVLHPASVNTLRMVTTRSASKGVVLLTCCLRIGAHGRRVDNWASGGIVVKVDPFSGCLSGPGYFKPGKGGRVSVHPDTQVPLEGYQLPLFAEAIDLCKRAHSVFEYTSIGWDVAILEDGPTIIEGNGRWDGNIPMTLDPEFVGRFISSVSPSEVGRPAKTVANAKYQTPSQKVSVDPVQKEPEPEGQVALASAKPLEISALRRVKDRIQSIFARKA
jgi:hypothetical protein